MILYWTLWTWCSRCVFCHIMTFCHIANCWKIRIYLFFLKQSFTLEFYFEPNEYFTNTVLTKVYKMKSEPDADDPFSFEGPEIIDCEGWAVSHLKQYWLGSSTDFHTFSLFMISPVGRCEIDWHKGKDVTVKTIKKKQKHKGRGTARVITKQVPNDSFFNFFDPIKGMQYVRCACELLWMLITRKWDQ